MADKFLPNADGPFQFRVQTIANTIGTDPGRFMLSNDDAEAIRRAVDEFVAAYRLTTAAGTRTKLTLM